MKNESIQGKHRGAGSFWNRQSKDPHTDFGSGGDKQGDDGKKGCAFALALLICVPLLTCFAFLALAMTLARVVPEITDYVLR